MNCLRIIALFILNLGCVVASAQTPPPVAFRHFSYEGNDVTSAQPLPKGHYRNPILSGFHPDPSICRVGDDYYIVNSSFIYFPGLPIFHSKDLVNWTQVGNAIDRPGQLNFDDVGVSQGLYAPAITWHDGTFYIICTMVGSHLSSGWSVNFVITAKDPAGPWSDPVLLGFDGMDPSLFFDDDGRAYIVNNGSPEGGPKYPGHCAIWLQEFAIDSKKMIGRRIMIVNGGDDLSQKPWYIEGPHLYKHGGRYYLFCAQGGTEINHSEVVFRGDCVDGPYNPWKKNPILTQRDLAPVSPNSVTCAGHADVVRGPDGKDWAVFLACRPYQKSLYITGRETFLLPMTWTEDDWPIILPAGQRVPTIVESPRGASLCPNARTDFNGDFAFGQTFRTKSLGSAWIMLRQPHERWWRIRDHALWITPQKATLSPARQPAFLARRIQHACFKATTELAWPIAANVSAGIGLFQNEKHFYFLGVRNGDKPEIFLEQQIGDGPPRKLTSAVLPKLGASLSLRVEVNDAMLSVDFIDDGKTWHTLADHADATILTTQIAGGFVGAVVGLHARIETED